MPKNQSTDRRTAVNAGVAGILAGATPLTVFFAIKELWPAFIGGGLVMVACVVALGALWGLSKNE